LQGDGVGQHAPPHWKAEEDHVFFCTSRIHAFWHLLALGKNKTKQNKKWKEVVGGIERYEPCFKKAQDCSFLSAFPRPAAYDQALRKQVLEDSFLTQHHVHG